MSDEVIQALPVVPQVPKLEKLFSRLLREVKAKSPVEIDADRVDAEMRGIFFGMRCMMSVDGAGYKTRKGIALGDAEIQARADATITIITNTLLYAKAAHDVLIRHGLDGEYKAQLEHLQYAIGKKVPQITEEQKVQVQAILGNMLKGAGDGIKLSDAGGQGNGAMGKESVLGDSEEPAT